MAEEVLAGGVANAGAVVRSGDHVLRPSNPHTPTIHRFLGRLHAAGFDGACLPLGVDPDGRERLVFVPGEVPVPPYPPWAQTDDALASVARLLRRFHEASARVGVDGDASWSTRMADRRPPEGGGVVCHNDVCLENVVFREGEAVALLDFDYAGPGRPLLDLAHLARMCVPIDDPSMAARLGWAPVDAGRRLRLVADAYGVPAGHRGELLELLAGTISRGGEFVLERVEAGDPGFVAMWAEIGGMARFDARRAWFARARADLARALA